MHFIICVENVEMYIVILQVTSCSQNRRNNDEPGEKIAYLAIVSWVKHDISARVQHFSSLFSMLRIPALSRDFLKDVVLNEV